MTYFVVIVVGILWFIAIGRLMWRALDGFYDGDLTKGYLSAAVAIVVFSAPMAAVMSAMDSDPYANQLCARGHEEWRTTRHGPVLVGKVVVPAGTSTRKVWVCESWEAR